jgi:NAD(P)-dependent dehydrogenase (short-subunit alcohol dehydrogenase family)
VAVVTGASRGIGRQLCVDLARDGWDVVCVARSSDAQRSRLPGTVDETAAAVRAAGREALAVGLDVRDEPAIAALAERVYAEWGRCDLLVNNAAVAPPLPALRDSTKRWRLAVDVNLNGPFYFMYYFCPRMARHGGRVVNVSSGAAVMPAFGRPSYTATKAALEGLSQALALELRGRVAVDCLRIDLPIWSEGFQETIGREIAFEDPVIISDAVLWMARRPLAETGRIFEVRELRERGVVRPETSRSGAPAPGA